ncbi:MAG: alpha/beta fold hydrolase [Alphaproteobacteria bacterium]|nr:alpha/beta fold hydrolase [Alphaproteobacteria bacterium]
MIIARPMLRVIVAFILGLFTSFGSCAFAEDGVSLRMIEGFGGVPLNVAEAGKSDNPGLLFIHGNGQGYMSWHRQLSSSLANAFHLVAFDLRGHANSGKPWDVESYNRACIWAEDVAAVIRETGLDKPIIVGWSRGGLMAMHYVRCFGTDELSGIVMVSSRGRLVDVPLPASDSPARVSQVQLEESDIESNMAGAQTFASLMTAEPMDEEWTALSAAMNVMSPPYARRAMRSPVYDPTGEAVTSYASLVDKINVPFLAIMGDQDPFRETSQLSAAFVSALPQAQILIYSGVGHSPFLERPDRFNMDLNAFAQNAFAAH